MAITSYAAPIVSAKRPQGRVSAGSRAVRKVALLGFGVVGSAVAEILCSQHFPELRLTHILNRNVARKRQPWVPTDVRWTEDFDEILSSDVDLVVELMGGLDPAAEWILTALRVGKSVVTANKHLIASRGMELDQVARQHGQHLEFGASVAGGVPVLNAVAAGLAGESLLRLQGVLNGTCNYILSNMDCQSMPFDTALRKAQQLGYAEADPSDDVHGVDARCKLSILAHAGFGLNVRAEQIFTRSITAITDEDFRHARRRGCTIRQVSIAERTAEGLRAFVQPAMVPLHSPLAQVKDNQNVLVTTGLWGGETVFAGRGAGGGPTAVAVVSDLLSIARRDGIAQSRPAETGSSVEINADFEFPYYLRVPLKSPTSGNRVLQAIADSGLQMEPGEQHPEHSSTSLMVFLKPCKTQGVVALEVALKKQDCLEREPLCLPVLCQA